MRHQQQHAGDRTQQRLKHWCQQDRPGREITPGKQSHTQGQHMRHHEQGKDLSRLTRNTEPQQTTVNANRQKTQGGVGKRMLCLLYTSQHPTHLAIDIDTRDLTKTQWLHEIMHGVDAQLVGE